MWDEGRALGSCWQVPGAGVVCAFGTGGLTEAQMSSLGLAERAALPWQGSCVPDEQYEGGVVPSQLLFLGHRHGFSAGWATSGPDLMDSHSAVLRVFVLWSPALQEAGVFSLQGASVWLPTALVFLTVWDADRIGPGRLRTWAGLTQSWCGWDCFRGLLPRLFFEDPMGAVSCSTQASLLSHASGRARGSEATPRCCNASPGTSLQALGAVFV